MEENKILNINLWLLLKVLWKEKLIVIVTTITFLLGGIYYALSLREEFTAIGKILPEYQSKSGGLGQFAGLASLAGIDVSNATGAGADAIRPDLYPDVLKSTPFFLELFKTTILTKDNQKMSFNQYYENFILEKKIKKEHSKIKFPVSDQYIAISIQTENNLRDLRQRINATIDKKSGLITVTVKLPDPVVATIVTSFSMNFLTSYITNYRTEKAKRDLDFLAERLGAAKGKYYTNQAKKAQYNDQYQSSIMKLQTADLQRERIESEYKISSTFYNTLLQKYEEAKLKLQQETPVIKVLDPPIVPNTRSEPKRSVIVLLATLLGGTLGVIFAIIRNKNYKLVIK